ncbi:polyprenyl synthetase family protein [Candidatus Bipolaricaulota bacterium]|nr:polyprenyl synthetase family protein [Candidatus Bipolaricaulota bacterium]
MALLEDILDPIKNDLIRLEEELAELVDSNLQPLTGSSSYLLNSGGKRLRPALVLLSGKLFDYKFEKVKPLAIAVEFVHMASLVHDDVIDDSRFRRGSEAVNYKWGNKVAVLSGDLLYTFAASSLTKLEDSKYLKHLLEAALEMTRGQANQTINGDHYKLSFKEYIKRIRQKTGLLMGKSCLLGAKATGAGKADQQKMEDYGLNLGLSFQITDDLKDLIGSREELGKEPGNDLKEGTLTLPIMIALEESPRSEILRNLLGREDPKRNEIEKGIEIVKGSGAIEESLKYSKKFADKAKAALPVARQNQEAENSLRIAARFFGGEEVRGRTYLGRGLPVQGST